MDCWIIYILLAQQGFRNCKEIGAYVNHPTISSGSDNAYRWYILLMARRPTLNCSVTGCDTKTKLGFCIKSSNQF
jgi:hypothetical protein